MGLVIWGLDLAEIKWSKFKSSYMWNANYHLRRTKFIVYQCAMIFCVVSESLGTAALSDYIDQEKYVYRLGHGLEYNNDYVGIASYNIFCGIFVAFIFGAAFFFDLFWPERHEDRGIKIAWKACAVWAVIFGFADALALTVITATHSASISWIGSDEASQLVTHFGRSSPLKYRTNPRALAAVVFVWPGWCCTLASCIILFFSYNHNDKFGPFSSHVRTQRDIKEEVARPSTIETDPEAGMMKVGQDLEKERGPGEHPAVPEKANGS